MASRDPESVVARTVAVVGCGPGGMFFLHALELHRKKLLEEGKSIADLPVVTCFERASGPGGAWRSERVFQADQEKHDPPEEKKVNIEPPTNTIEKDTKHGCNDDEPELATMCEALWTNGAKENTEFYDCTYNEHFGRRLPVHLPRRSVLECMIARVTRNTPTLLENHVQFNTTVSSVTCNEGSKKFVVLTKDNFTGQATSGECDKCTWAAGENGTPFVPKDLAERPKAFSGTIVHSSDASELDKHVQHKRTLLTGGSYSAEDLALMSVKLGVEKVCVSFRDVDAWVTHTSWWPQDKVELLADKVPLQASGNSVEFIKTRFDGIGSQFETDEEQKTVLEDIDAITFCAG